MFSTAIAGSLPKPEWLAETNKLWPKWQAEGDALLRAKADATLFRRQINFALLPSNWNWTSWWCVHGPTTLRCSCGLLSYWRKPWGLCPDFLE